MAHLINGLRTMPRFKPCDTALKFIPVDFAAQILPGTFEHALCHMVDKELDLRPLISRFKNDEVGASAYSPAVMLKIILLAYSRGIVKSRRIERACRENVMFIAISGDSVPHFTTIADFVAKLGKEMAPLFARVLVTCDRLGLIGREMFAIDGVKLPSNASKARSGTREDLQARGRKMQARAEQMIAQHCAQDAAKSGPQQDSEVRERERELRSLKRLQKEAQLTQKWLIDNPEDRKGASGKVVMSNLTDNESAKMATSKGVVQGYTGVAAVDAKHQIIVCAQAHGTGSEQALLLPIIEALQPMLNDKTVLVADAGYHSSGNINKLEEEGRPAFICDNQYRLRDPRYADQIKHRTKKDPLHDKSGKTKSGKTACYKPIDFRLASDQSHCLCPAGKRLYRNGGNCTIHGDKAMRFRSNASDCNNCTQRTQCLQKPETSQTRQVSFFLGKRDESDAAVNRMKARIDSEEGKKMIAARFATVEPVFGNIRGNKQLDRFTLRGQAKVDVQWQLMCMMHNIEKVSHYGYAK